MKRRLLASILSFVMVLSLLPVTALADGEDDVTPQEPAVDVTVNNPYSNDGITIDGVTVVEGLATVKVSYAKANQMAGIAYSYMVDGEEVTDRAIAQQIDGDGIPQTDKNNINGYLRDCTVYTFPVEEGVTKITVTVDGSTFWNYDAETKTLTISGEGSMADFRYLTIDDNAATVNEQCQASFPWAEYRHDIEEVVVEDGITRLGVQSFRKFFNLKNLTVKSDDLVEIGWTLCMNDSALEVFDLTACTNLSVIGSGVLTGMKNTANITVKMAKPVAGAWRANDNYTPAYTTFVYSSNDGSFTEGDWECYVVDGNKVELNTYIGNDSAVTIPATITHDGETYDVVSVSGGLFGGNTNITKVVFAENSQVTEIPSYFVNWCSKVEEIVLPSRLKNVGTYALSMYSNVLTKFQIGSDDTCIDLTKVESINDLAFANLHTKNISAKNVKISNNLKSIGAQILRNDTFSKLVLTEGDYSDVLVADNAFNLLTLTNGVELETGVVNADKIIAAFLRIGKVKTFTQDYANGSITYTVNPDGTVNATLNGEASEEAGNTWYGLTIALVVRANVSDGWEITKNETDHTCTITGYTGEKTALLVPKKIDGYTVKAIGDDAFRNDLEITSISFADDSECETIGAYAFYASTKDKPGALASVSLPKSLKKIGSCAFMNRANIKEFPDLPDGLETISDGAFWNVTSAEKAVLVIPDTVTSIGDQAFRWCGKLTRIVVKAESIHLGCQAFNMGGGMRIDLSAVKNLTMGAETDKGFYKFNLPAGSIIYVANDNIAKMLNDAENSYDSAKTCIVSVNGGTVDSTTYPTGLSSVTRKDGSTTYTAVWYEDGEEMTDPTTNLEAGSTYSVKWVADIDGGYQVAAIADQTYTGAEIKPAVVVTNSEGNVLTTGYTVDYSNNVNVGKATATVAIGSESVVVSFNIVKDMNPTVTMEDAEVTYVDDSTEHQMTATAKTSAGNPIDDTLDIKYYTDSACTVEAENHTDAGTYYVKATLNGTDNYASASAVAKLVVKNATFKVTATGYADTYDGKPHTVTVTADGAKISYSADAGEYKTYGSTAPTFTDVGEYTVYYKAVKANHDDVTGSVRVKITPAVLTATYVSEAVRYGAAPALKVDVTGFVNDETAETAADYVAPTVANSNTAVGEYTLTPEGGSAKNYTFNYVSGTLTILRRPSNPGNTVSVPSTPNGTVTVNPSTATKDTTVTITTKPNEGYELGDLTVKDANGNTLPLTDKGDGKYTFTMPDSKVVVEASFVKAAPTSFADVPANAYFADAVKWAVDKGITNGLTDTMFGPYESCTRAQIVTFLWRAAGSPEPKAMSSFTDVPASAYYAKAVAWAVENGITNGMTETTFAPDATCTRGQSVTFLYRALKGTASGSANFTDVPANAFYADAVNWAVANNVTNGTSATTFSPNADCTRAEIVTFLYRAYQGK